MGTIPVIRIKGMSRLQYNFEWDKESRHYAYEPKDQREADDIFRTQGRLYKRMFFSVLIDEKKKEAKPKKAEVEVEADHHFVKEEKASTIEGVIRQTTKNPIKKKKAEKPAPKAETKLQAVVSEDTKS